MVFKWVAEHFHELQIAFFVMVILFAWNSVRSGQKESKFKKREATRTDLHRLLKTKSELADAKLKKKSHPPLSLPGITLTGKPHEILGVDARADRQEILKAYKEKIKLFHPDRIQGQAREQIKFYEEASAKLNEAKEAMLEQLKK